jgi:hypothetical protein
MKTRRICVTIAELGATTNTYVRHASCGARVTPAVVVGTPVTFGKYADRP